MRKTLSLLLIASTFFCYSQSTNTISTNEYSFQDNNEIITPKVDYSKVFVVFDENLTESDIIEFEAGNSELTRDRSQSFPGHNKKLYTLGLSVSATPEAAEAFLSGIRAEQSVLSAYPAFIRGNDIAYLDNILLVNMDNKHASKALLAEITAPFNGLLIEELDLISSRTYAISVPAEVNIFNVCMALDRYDEVAFAQPNFYFSGTVDFTPDDPMFSDQWFLNQASDADIDAVEAWDITTGLSSIAVAVIDGHGFDLVHAEMAGKYLSPYNAVDDNNDPEAVESEENHGTPCSGLIGALTNNSVGVASVGYNTMVVPIKMGFNFGGGGTFQTTELILTRACEHVMTSPYDIVAVSNSYTMGSWANIQAIRTAFANMRTDSRGGLGCVVLASTGNDDTYNYIGYPFHFPHVVGVGSTDRYDSRSSFSNYGDSTDLAAPGTDTWTIDRSGLPGYSFTDYYEFGGTSAACPIAAAVVGLIASVNPGYTGLQLRTQLYSSCDKVGGYSYSNNPSYPYGTWSLHLGYGRVNAFEAVQGGTPPFDPPTGLTADVTGTNVYLSWTAPGGGGGTEEELIYDNNTSTGAYKYPGYTLSTHMSPSGPCQVLKLKYYTTNEGSDKQFYAKVFDWTGSQPGTTVLYNSTETAANAAWVEVDISASGINVTGDFVVGFGSFTEEAFIGYDAGLNNGRSWDFQESAQTWSTWDEAYLIRAVVLYPDGKTAVLGGNIPETIATSNNNTSRKNTGTGGPVIAPIPNRYMNLLGLLGYQVYRDGTALNSNPLTNTWYNDNGLAIGTYNYTVTALYDLGESDPAGPVQATVSGTVLNPPTNLQSSVNGSTVNLSWYSPQGGIEEWIAYHDGTFESSFASTDGGAGIAQLFTLSSTPVSLNDIRFFTTNFENWDQPMTVYVLSGDGNTILGGPYTSNGVNNNWINIATSIVIDQSTFMIATYNDDPGGPYVGVDDSFFNETLFFGSHTNGFTELSQLGNFEYVGSHEANVMYQDKRGRLVSEWLRPADAGKTENAPVMHLEKEALSAPYPSENRALLGYNIYRDGTKINTSTWTSTSYADPDLANGTYAYTVTAVYDEGESGPAGPVQATVNASGLEVPINLSGYASTGDIANLSWIGPGGSQEELIYDNNETTSGYNYPGYTMATHMSPASSCQILTLKYLTSVDPGDNTFDAKVFNWGGTQPGNTILYENDVTAIEGWLDIDVTADNIFVDGDFVVGFGSLNEQTFLAFDGNLDNGRSWDREDATSTWSSWTEAYLIRAVVQYSDGTLAEIGGGKDLQGYNLYRDNVKVNSSLISGTNTTDIMPGEGTYDYNVTAVYDEGESAFSNTFTLKYYLGIEEPQQIDVNIYPNPAYGQIFIESQDEISKLTLLSPDGKNVRMLNEKGFDLQLNVSELDAGLYILKIETEKGIGAFKILIR
ncbi:MAG: S8 family serine peptidase [Bacteroidales bacterium]|nr:S8 family serine peptidase [Bacteroidales bacterium]